MFIESENILWEDTEPGVRRKITAYDDKLMMVVVNFAKGSKGSIHSHPHRQATYIAKGIFEIQINGKKKVLKEGDSFFVDPDLKHGVVCQQDGILVDVFTPARKDFLCI